MSTPKIPEGYWADARGRLTPVELIKPIDRARNDLVVELIQNAQRISAMLAEFKAAAMEDVAAFVDLSLQEYGVRWGGNKGNVSLTSFDGRWRVQLAMQERLVFDERLQAAKELIDECVKRWTQGARSEIRALIDSAFEVDKHGRISTGRVLGLRRHDIKDPQWRVAMDAISDSVTASHTVAYIRFFERLGEDKWRQIPLDIASVSISISGQGERK